jgi:2-keto-4-pentenoate hydratase/2-oxohepta-3-ene-1,7-dioic acid hydratase in catechol pathway
VRGTPRFGCPVAQVGKFIAIGLELRRSRRRNPDVPIPKEPVVFMKATSLHPRPAMTRCMLPARLVKTDWEVELRRGDRHRAPLRCPRRTRWPTWRATA